MAFFTTKNSDGDGRISGTDAAVKSKHVLVLTRAQDSDLEKQGDVDLSLNPVRPGSKLTDSAFQTKSPYASDDLVAGTSFSKPRNSLRIPFIGLFLLMNMFFTVGESAFEYYEYYQLWSPTYCAEKNPGKCKIDVVENKFSLHGLFPTDYQIENGAINCPDPHNGQLPYISQTLKSKMITHWPSFTMDNEDFWKLQWQKHGTCSELSFSEYVGTVISNYYENDAVDIYLMLANADIFPKDISEDPEYHSPSTFHNILGDKFGDAIVQIRLLCTDDHLYEIVICMAKNRWDFIDCPKPGTCFPSFRYLLHHKKDEEEEDEQLQENQQVNSGIHATQQITLPQKLEVSSPSQQTTGISAGSYASKLSSLPAKSRGLTSSLVDLDIGENYFSNVVILDLIGLVDLDLGENYFSRGVLDSIGLKNLNNFLIGSNMLNGPFLSDFLKRIDMKSMKKDGPLLGDCIENETDKFLVDKHMPKGNMSNCVFFKNTTSEDGNLQSLDWITRLKIATGAAEAIFYLHHECIPPFVHSEKELKEWLDYILTCFGMYDNEVAIVEPSLVEDEDFVGEVWAIAIVARSFLNPKHSREPPMRYVLKALENPLKVVREEGLSSAQLKATSSRGSWNATLFGSWLESSSDVTTAPAASGTKLEGKSSLKLSGSSSSRRRHSDEICPEPSFQLPDVERLELNE